MPTEYFEQRERALLGPRYEQLYAAPQEAAERGVTVSALRAMPEQFAQKADFPLEVSPFCKAAFVVHAPEFKPGRHPYHHAGVFYSQEPSASSAAPLLGVQPGMRVLDLCAAPGGKSSQLAAALQGRGVLVSNEYVAARAEILKSNLERMGVPNAVVLNETPARIAEALPEFFDRVLVDAPCSGEGMFRKEPVARQQHCEALVKQCAELGAQILDCAAAALAPGGQLVYSTCTFAPEEDEGQVAAFLQRHPEFELADALGNVDYTFGSEGEANRTGGLPLDVRKVRRIWPCQGGEGHFMARLVKAGTPRTLPAAGEYTPEELMTMEKATTGLYLSGHPMDHDREIVRKLNAPSILSILADFAREDGPERFADGQRVTIAGVITSSKTKTTKNNSLMAYVMVEDDTASMELLCFSRVLETCGAYMKENLAVVVKGRLSVRDEKAPQIVCDSIYPLTTADGGIPEPQPKQEASGETLFLKFPSIEDPAIRHMKLVFQMFPGKSTVKMVMADTRKVYAAQALLHPALVEEAKETLGSANVVVK